MRMPFMYTSKYNGNLVNSNIFRTTNSHRTAIFGHCSTRSDWNEVRVSRKGLHCYIRLELTFCHTLSEEIDMFILKTNLEAFWSSRTTFSWRTPGSLEVSATSNRTSIQYLQCNCHIQISRLPFSNVRHNLSFVAWSHFNLASARPP